MTRSWASRRPSELEASCPRLYSGTQSHLTTDEEICDLSGRRRARFITRWRRVMGQAGDEMALMNPAARVHGIKGSRDRGIEGLRVVDSSAFPFAVLGLPQASVHANKEKIAEDILMGTS